MKRCILIIICIVLIFTCLFAVGISRNISIENGFAAFAKDTVKTVFFGEDEQEYMSIDVLLADLKQHGYSDILFPQEFMIAAGGYKATVPKYTKDNFREQVSFVISDSDSKYNFGLGKVDLSNLPFSFDNLYSAETVVVNGVHIYVFEFKVENLIQFNHNNIHYTVTSDVPLSDMIKIAESIK